MSNQTIDYSEATTEERYEALKSLLEDYTVSFGHPRVEALGNPYKTNINRVHYSVRIEKEGKVEVFPFFQGEKMRKYATGDHRYQPLPDRDKPSRFVSFFYCLASDYSFLESEGIKDALDYMGYFGITDANEARKTYTALRDAEQKLNNIFGASIMTSIASIVEGY